jgi:phosphoglucomutase
MTSPLAGKPAPPDILVDLGTLEHAYYERRPDMDDPGQRVAFGTSGHRGSSLRGAFNESHILAITQAICDYRRGQGIDGPLCMGKDTHALPAPAQRAVLEVLAANGVETIVQRDGGVTPRRRSSRARSSCTTRAAPGAWPTVSSSRPRTTRPTTGASSTTRRTAAPLAPR